MAICGWTGPFMTNIRLLGISTWVKICTVKFGRITGVRPSGAYPWYVPCPFPSFPHHRRGIQNICWLDIRSVIVQMKTPTGYFPWDSMRCLASSFSANINLLLVQLCVVWSDKCWESHISCLCRLMTKHLSYYYVGYSHLCTYIRRRCFRYTPVLAASVYHYFHQSN